MSESPVYKNARGELDAWRERQGQNRFDADPFFQRLLQRLLGDEYPALAPRLQALAVETGDAFSDLVAESNRDAHLPSLRRHDPDGRPVEEVVFHPAYHQVGERFWASGVLAELADPGHEVSSGAKIYLLDQHGEAGHACPVACTAGAIKLLQRVGTDAQRQRYLPRLLSADYASRLHAAQFVTEVQGGSDVGANACVATPAPNRPGWYRLHGEKWFCSVADAGLFVVSARLEAAPTGTAGLGLFLVPRTVAGAPNGFALHRLKDKLGTRSMATGEIELQGALGEAIGPTDRGFRNLVGIVLDTSRVQNGLAACGIMRRAFSEASGFASHRRAFGEAIDRYPMVQEVLARMWLRAAAGLATTFRILAISDQIDTGRGNDDLAAARRIAVMINKYWTALGATRSARDGIEVLGGNGTIEEFSPLPRLYRDAIVVESWEGTHNTLVAQVGRDFAVRGLHRPWLGQLTSEIDAITRAELSGHAARARTLHERVGHHIEELLATTPEIAAATARHVVNRMCQLTDWAALLTQAQWDLEQSEASACLDALELYRLTEIERRDPVEVPALVELQARVAGGQWQTATTG